MAGGLSRPDARGLPDRLNPEDRARRYTLGSSNPADPQTLLAIDEYERLLGFAAVAPSAELAKHGELRALYVDPPHWRGGVSRAHRAFASVAQGVFADLALIRRFRMQHSRGV